MNSNVKFLIRDEAGISLIETLIAVAISGVVFLGVSSGLKNMSASASNLRLRGEVLDVRATVRTAFDCEATLAQVQATCLGASTPVPVDLYRKDGSRLISNATHERLGSGFDLRSSCVDKGGIFEFGVEVQRTDPSGRPVAGPRTDLPPGFQPLLSAPLACSSCSDASELLTDWVPFAQSSGGYLYGKSDPNRVKETEWNRNIVLKNGTTLIVGGQFTNPSTTVSKIELYNDTGAKTHFGTQWTVETSMDGVSWTSELASVTGELHENTMILPRPVSAKFIRIRHLGLLMYPGWDIDWVKFYGCKGPE